MAVSAVLFSYFSARLLVDLLFTEGAFLVLVGGIVAALPERTAMRGEVASASVNDGFLRSKRQKVGARIVAWGITLLLLSVLIGEIWVRGTGRFW